jgi:hypothetical protein|tara:strand:- start:659 stop:1006 length:348 start_codon:yes stop_codon:yes gene_type:complete
MANLTGFRSDRDGLFAVKDPASNIQYGLDFTDYLNAGDSVSSATVAISTVSGDSSPLALPTNPATDVTITGGTLVNIRVHNGSLQNVYTIKVTIVTSQGDTDARSFRVIVQEKKL